MEPETMTNAVCEQKREINHQAPTHGPDREADLSANRADIDRQRRTNKVSALR